jgi:hypothetical protein
MFAFPLIYQVFFITDNWIMTEANASGTDRSAGAPGIRATKRLKAGDVLFSDKHFVHIVLQQYKRKFCDNCFTAL